MAGLGRRTHYRKHLTDQVLFDTPEPSGNETIAKIVNTRGGNQFDILLSNNHNSSDGKNNDNTINSNNNSSSSIHQSSLPQLAILPTKFHKLVWVKRNDFVIVQTGIDDDRTEEVDEAGNREDQVDKITLSTTDDKDSSVTTSAHPSSIPDDVGGGIRYIIKHILYKEQVKHLRTKGLWPEHDPEFFTSIVPALASATTNPMQGGQHGDTTTLREDGIVYSTNYYNLNHDDDDDENDENDIKNDDALMFVNTNRLARVEIQDSSSSEEEEE
jgi:probable RNA-binding protein EIF1AD